MAVLKRNEKYDFFRYNNYYSDILCQQNFISTSYSKNEIKIYIKIQGKKMKFYRRVECTILHFGGRSQMMNLYACILPNLSHWRGTGITYDIHGEAFLGEGDRVILHSRASADVTEHKHANIFPIDFGSQIRENQQKYQEYRNDVNEHFEKLE